jgi:hypothetical protein
MLNDTLARRGATTADAALRRREIDRLRAFSDRIALLARFRNASTRRRLLRLLCS